MSYHRSSLLTLLSLVCIGCSEAPPGAGLQDEAGNITVYDPDDDQVFSLRVEEDFWEELCAAYPYAPQEWAIRPGDETEGPFVSEAGVRGLSFSPDDSLLALAGGGHLQYADGSIRIIDVETKKNIRTLWGHVAGLHDVSFDPRTGVLASASYDASVKLWNVGGGDVIYLTGGEEEASKYLSRFSRSGSYLAVGEEACFGDDRSLTLYDLNARKIVFDMALPDELGVRELGFSQDSKYLAFVSDGDRPESPARLYVLNIETGKIAYEYSYPQLSFFDIKFVEGHHRILAGTYSDMSGEYESYLMEIDAETGEIGWTEKLGGIGVEIAVHPLKSIVAVGFENPSIRLYSTVGWEVIRELPYADKSEKVSVYCLEWSHRGHRLAYGFSGGLFDIIHLQLP